VTGPPPATPVTTPAALTDATPGAELVHVKVLPLSVWPPAFVARAPNVAVEPATIVVLAGCTAMLAITVSPAVAVTVIVALADLPAVDAVIDVEPTAIAVTTPPALTVATEVAELVQVNTLPPIT
jgi:hypothetical protein